MRRSGRHCRFVLVSNANHSSPARLPNDLSVISPAPNDLTLFAKSLREQAAASARAPSAINSPATPRPRSRRRARAPLLALCDGHTYPRHALRGRRSIPVSRPPSGIIPCVPPMSWKRKATLRVMSELSSMRRHIDSPFFGLSQGERGRDMSTPEPNIRPVRRWTGTFVQSGDTPVPIRDRDSNCTNVTDRSRCTKVM